MRTGLVRSVALAAVAGLAGPIVGCGSSASDSSGTFKPSGRPRDQTASPQAGAGAAGQAPPSTVSARQAEAEALRRYREYQRVYKRVYATNDPAELSTVAMDPLLSNVTKAVQGTRDRGEIWRFTNAINPKIQGITKDNSTVVVIDCVRTLGAYVYSARTGKRIRELSGEGGYYQAVLKYDSGNWKVSEARKGNKC